MTDMREEHYKHRTVYFYVGPGCKNTVDFFSTKKKKINEVNIQENPSSSAQNCGLHKSFPSGVRLLLVRFMRS